MIPKGIILWFRRFHDKVTGFLAAVIVTVTGYMLVLSFCRMLWRLYSETKVGGLFAAGNEQLFSNIDAVMSRTPLMLSLEISFLSITACFVIAFISHFSLLKRIIYDSREISGKILYAGIPCVVLTAAYFEPANLLFSIIMCLLPGLALFSYCFEMVEKFLPETDDLIKAVVRKIRG